MKTATPWGLDHSYAQLPAHFFAQVEPTAVPAPRLLALNVKLAEQMGLDARQLASPEGVQMLAGNALPLDARPIALAYAGHQFGHFSGRLGDGRAILLGERVGPDGVRRDIQLKGAGRTPFSRGGDGRAAVGPVLREYVVSEAMAALGIPTTRSLAAVATGEDIDREQGPLPGAVLTRVAASHVRVGTFELFAAAGDSRSVELLVDHCVARHYPDASDSENKALALLEHVVQAHANLVAQWLGVGFIHGVMNTDNTSISGETLDYGPCAFLDTYEPGKRFSSIDRQGRYAYANQPSIAVWNLTRLAETLIPLIASDQKQAVALATGALDLFSNTFQRAYAHVFGAKIGLARHEPGDMALITELLAILARTQADFTVFFRALSSDAPPADPAFRVWNESWQARLQGEASSVLERQEIMKHANPAVIPRNHRIEEMITAAIEQNDLKPFEELMRVLSRPFDDQLTDLTLPPRPEERVTATFCGT